MEYKIKRSDLLKLESINSGFINRLISIKVINHEYLYQEEIPFSKDELDAIYEIIEAQGVLLDICPEYVKNHKLKNSLSEAIRKMKIIVDNCDNENYDKLEGILHDALEQKELAEKENDKYIDIFEPIDKYSHIINIRNNPNSEYHHKSFWLNSNYGWDIVCDNCGVLCLVPT